MDKHEPDNWARFTPQVPDGMIVIPGTMFAAHSFAASSALTPALPESILLCTTNATLHPPKTVPFASRRSTAMSSIGSTPGLGCRKGFFTAGALVSGSMILNASPILYFSHIAFLRAIGNAVCRSTTTAVAASGGFVSRKVYAKASGKPE